MVVKIIIAVLAFFVWIFSLVIARQQVENAHLKEQYKTLEAIVMSIAEPSAVVEKKDEKTD